MFDPFGGEMAGWTRYVGCLGGGEPLSLIAPKCSCLCAYINKTVTCRLTPSALCLLEEPQQGGAGRVDCRTCSLSGCALSRVLS